MARGDCGRGVASGDCGRGVATGDCGSGVAKGDCVDGAINGPPSCAEVASTRLLTAGRCGVDGWSCFARLRRSLICFTLAGVTYAYPASASATRESACI